MIENSAGFGDKMKTGLGNGLKKGWSGAVWMLEILVPISFLTLLLDYSGWLGRLDFILEPLMGILHLPPFAALPLIVGMLTGIYGGIAAMAILPFTIPQMTLIAIFLLISHNLVQEGVIQGKTGIHPIAATLFRLLASVVTVMVCAQFMDTAATVQAGSGQLDSAGAFWPMLGQWTADTLKLSVKILLIIMALMIVLESLKVFELIPAIVRVLSPLLKLMGLDRQVGLLWLTAAVFGLSYGGALIMEETKENDFTPEELTKLHLSIGTNHSLIEDPFLFLPLGLSPFWLWIPRLVLAIAVVRLFSVWKWFRRVQAQPSAGL